LPPFSTAQNAFQGINPLKHRKNTPRQLPGKAFQTLGKAFRTLGKAFRTLGKAFRTLGKAFRTLGKAFRTLGKAYQTPREPRRMLPEYPP
jgi:hypothetical protein